MSTLSVLPELIGFFSYSRDDDEGSRGALSALRDAIQGELSAQLGRTQADFRVWQDKTAISHGTLWENQIARGINQAVFFIPIVSPRALRSQHCIFEFESFLAREAKLGRDDLVFPILYIPVPELEDEKQWRQDPVLKIVGTRQYLDWRDLRPRGLHEPEVQTKIIHFCRNISNALRKPWVPIEEREAAEKAAADARERAAAAERTRQEEQAKRRADQEQAFAKAKDADTLAAFSAFISTYPESHLAGDAQNAKARLLARDKAHGHAMASDDQTVLESFLNSYPNGLHADEIRGRLRTLQLKADDEIRLAKQKEERERAEQEQAFARAKDADSVAAFSAFIERYPNSHLAGDAQKEKARLHARDEPPPERDPKTQRQERQESDLLRDAKSRSKPSRAALEWGAVGAISYAVTVVQIYFPSSSTFWNSFSFTLPFALAAVIMLYRSHLSLGRAAAAGAALAITRGFTAVISFPLIGGKGLLLISIFPTVVLALFDPRLRAPSVWLKVLAVGAGFGLVEIGLYPPLSSQLVLYWVISGLGRGAVFALLGYEIARWDAKPV
jgi:hypothetical protein